MTSRSSVLTLPVTSRPDTALAPVFDVLKRFLEREFLNKLFLVESQSIDARRNVGNGVRDDVRHQEDEVLQHVVTSQQCVVSDNIIHVRTCMTYAVKIKI